MKFEIRDTDETKEPTIELYLKKDSINRVLLCGHDSDGVTKDLLECRNGEFKRIAYAKLKGLETDSEEKVIII